MPRICALIGLFAAMLIAGPVAAQHASGDYGASYGGGARTVAVERWVEEWDPASGRWVRVSDEDAATIPATIPSSISGDAQMPVVTTAFVGGVTVTETRSAARYAVPIAPRAPAAMLGQYGPFVVTSPTSAALTGPTDDASPFLFDAMLRDFPHLAVLEMVEAPGTSNDIANLAVGRRIRAAGIATHVPRGGSVRSGAVELFLAGATRTLEDGAQFAVHSWLDNHGREADDFAASHPAHQLYLDYYVEMGMSESRAREFYAMTNSVPHAAALWLGSDDMRFWLRSEKSLAHDKIEGPVIPALAKFTAMLAERNALSGATAHLAIGYGDVTTLALAQLDLSLLDSAVALP